MILWVVQVILLWEISASVKSDVFRQFFGIIFLSLL